MKKAFKLFGFMVLAGALTFVACKKDEENTNKENTNKENTEQGDNNGDNGNKQDSAFADGVLPGVFSVSSTTKVQFSQGNLQYTTVGTHRCADGTFKPGTWRFALHQYDVVGENNAYISPTYSDWIDLFGWGTSGYHDSNDPDNVCFYPYSISDEELSDQSFYAGYGPSDGIAVRDLTDESRYYDWGVYNAISNGGDIPGMWRTLTMNEWRYLFLERDGVAISDVEDARYCKATVCDVPGVILFPDDYEHPAEISDPMNINRHDVMFGDNTYNATQWDALQKAGVVFFPAGFERYVTYIKTSASHGTYCKYWSSTANEYGSANCFVMNATTVSNYGTASSDGLSVRLVRECH